MDFIMENWFMIVTLTTCAAFVGVAVWRFLKLPKEDQIKAVREWLLMAVTEAEKELGEKTGKLKLRYVYDLFVVRFPWLAKAISFAWFSDMVDDALVEMRVLLEKNEAVKDYVEGR